MNTLARRITIPAVLGVLVTVIALSLAPAESALAAPKTVTLDVPGMTCAACPITVKTALTKLTRVPVADTARLDAAREYYVRVTTRTQPVGGSLLGVTRTIVGQARFSFVP